MREFNIDGEHISCSRKAGYSAAVKVRLGAKHLIPLECQVTVWAEPERIIPVPCLVEPVLSFEHKFSLKVASCLVWENQKRLPIRLLNVGMDQVQLYKGTTIAFLSSGGTDCTF